MSYSRGYSDSQPDQSPTERKLTMTEKTYERTFIRRLLNRLLLFPIRTGLGPARLHLLTVHGRKSGQPYTTPVSIIEQGGQRCLVSPYGEVSWVKNARSNGDVILTRAGRSVIHRITEVTPEEAGPVLKAYVQRESITYATITFQNLFRLYEKLAGMTGTAETEAEEFSKIYSLDVVVVPTHRPMVRKDHPDVVYINERAKFNAVVNEIEEMHTAGRPVLVGTTSIEKSEYLSTLLTRKGIPHEVLNAKQHEREALIVKDAGQEGAVTIATNMAGRGTDIKLGAGVAGLGGLHVLGTERHESRRIDNQLRGRAGRQGDPGSSRFFVSFGDDIMKRFAPDWMPGMMQKLGMTEDMPLESRMVTRAIEQAQTKVEGHNFDIRKRLVEFDDVINEHRKQIYTQRDMILKGVDTRDNVVDAMLLPEIERVLAAANPSDVVSLELAEAELREIFPPEDVPSIEEMQELGDELTDEMLDRAEDRYEQIEEMVGEENMRKVEHWLLLEAIDTHWREHLTVIEELRQSIGLQAYAQVDPLVAFKREGHDMYQQLVANIRKQVARTVFKVRVVQQGAQPAPEAAPPASPDGAGPKPSKPAAPVLAKPSGPSDEQIRTLGSSGQRAPAGKGSNSAKRRKLIR